jgi:hypothetical protein
MNEATWRRLLGLMRDGFVVPVIGARLLVGQDGRSSLQARVAERLLALYGVEVGERPLPLFRELNEAVTRLLTSGQHAPKLQDLYTDVYEAINEVTAAADFQIPTPIRQLAEITDFRLLVTLTPDDVLARSLRQRRAVDEVIHSPVLPSTEETDLPVDWAKRPSEAHLLYLFGKSRSAPMFAIHDEDVLEYAHNVIAREHYVPSKFLNELRQRNLLLIGCNFPEWLSRFFLRATSESRLSQRREWLIEEMQPTESLIYFLQSYSKDTEVLWQFPPVDFVAELHKRWTAERRPTAAPPPRAEAVPTGAMFFISYSRGTDQPRAETLYQTLRQMGVDDGEIWFDRCSIEPGQDFRQRILDGIRTCRYFVPILSAAAMQRDEAFVFDEWRDANDRNQRMNRDFILPTIVDNEYHPERYTARPVTDGDWARLDFCHAPEGLPDARMKLRLTQLVRDARRGAADHAA